MQTHLDDVSKLVDSVRSAERSKLPFMEEPAQALFAPLDDASPFYLDTTSDATGSGILDDNVGGDGTPTHEEQGTWRIEEVCKYRFNNRLTRHDEWLLIKWQRWPERRSNTWEPSVGT